MLKTMLGAIALTGYVRRDIENGEFVEIGGGITYECDCASVEVFLKRDFRESDDAPASTSVGVQVKLLTFGNKDDTSR